MALSDRGKGVLLIAISASAFGSTPIWGKMALSSGLNIETLLAFRLALASVLLWAVLWPRRSYGKVAPQDLPRLFLMAGLGFGITALCFFYALLHIPASLTQMIFFCSYPTLATLLSAWLLREALHLRKLAALFLAVAGGALMVWSWKQEGDLLWCLLPLASGIAYSLYIVLGSKVLAQHPPRVVSLWVITFGAVQFFGYGLALRRISFHLSGQAWGLIAIMAILCTVISVLCFFSGLERVGASHAAIISTLEPVVTLFLATFWLRERLSPQQLVGAATIIVGILLLQFAGRDSGSGKIRASRG
ncbi:MAG: DMT family transporter [candidate division NC10 bacterium]|nr:DMT family transporter [candidate division NC10 bacterium]